MRSVGTSAIQQPGEAYPHQARQEASRNALGLSGNAPPVRPIMPNIPAQNVETVLVAIIGTEDGGGCYKGCILSGASSGMDGSKQWAADSTVIDSGDEDADGSNTAEDDFQLQSSYISQIVDGPAPAANDSGVYTNNALVINLVEQYVPGSHLLYVNMAQQFYVQGRVMGVTNETPPRKIVYVQPVLNVPLIVKISAAEQSGLYGWYYGKIAPGLFGQNSVINGTPGGIPDVLPDDDNCWVANIWQNGKTTSALAAGSIVIAFLVGYGGGAIPGASVQTANTWNYVLFTFTVTAANPPSVTPLAVVTTQSALGTYTSNEQTMLNNLRQDVNNLHDALAALYTTLKNAGLAG